MQKEHGVSGVATGFEGIDRLTGGFQKANLIVLAARPGVGKTSLALNIAQNVAVDGKAPVAIFSLEMSAQELGERMMCSSARVSSHKVRTGGLSGDDYAKLVQAAGELEKADIFIDDTAGLNMFELRAKARRLKTKSPLSLVIVDYLQLMAGDSRAENRQQEVANISRSLKQLARELDVPVIAVSQLNRSPEARADREPQLADLRESGAIEQDADMVMFIYEDPSDPSSKGVVKLKIAKHRNGPTGMIRLGFVRDYTKFRTLSQREDYGVRRGVGPAAPAATPVTTPAQPSPSITTFAAPALDPVALLRALGLEGRSPVVLLDSAGGSPHLARRHYLAWDPVFRLRARGGVGRP